MQDGRASGRKRPPLTAVQHRHLRKSKGLLGTLDWQAKSVRHWWGFKLGRICTCSVSVVPLPLPYVLPQ